MQLEPPASQPERGTTVQPERANTDASLRTERKNTDEVLAEKGVDVESNADEVVERAREQADVVLETAREKADEKLSAQPEMSSSKSIEKERALEDALLERERAAADESLRRERAMLAALLPLEREKTDRYLLTERARSDDALAHRDDFLGMVSHDVRNILSAMGLAATQLSARASDSAEGLRTVEGMRRIQRYLARMDRLIGDLVDVVSIDAGKLALRKERCDVARLLTEAEEAFAPAASEKGVSLSAQLIEGPVLADFDHDRILQVLSNLIGNAIKFTPRGGEVSFRAEQVEDELRLSVKDTGAGIAGNLIERVFQRFWQHDPHEQRGLGLGLYISQCIVDAHGGKIWVESTVGAGSVFHFTIPSELVTGRRQ